MKNSTEKIKMVLSNKGIVTSTIASGDIKPAEYPWRRGADGFEYVLRFDLIGKDCTFPVILSMNYIPAG